VLSETDGEKVVELAAELTIAWLQNARADVAAEEVPAFLQRVHKSLTHLIRPADSEEREPREPRARPGAVTARKSLADPSVIVSMIDGRPYKSLKRHLAKHGFSPEDYRRHFNLPPDYPMVSRAYSERRRELAQSHGFKRQASATAKPRSRRG
jgi:predicted transcriptional regulator